MRRPNKLTLYLLSPLLLSALLTTVGLITGTVFPISIAGLIILVPLFLVFAFTDRLLLWLKAIREKRLSFKHFVPDPKVDADIKKQIQSSLDMPIEFTTIIRGVILSITFWIVGFFSTLCDGGISAFLGHLRENLLVTSSSLALAAIDMSRGKSIRKPGLPIKIISVLGAFSFFRSFLLLLSGLDGVRGYGGMKSLLSSPIWFLFKEHREAVIIWSNQMGFAMLLLSSVIVPFITFSIGMDMLKQPTTEDNIDSKNFALALVVISVWLGTQILAYPLNGLLQ